MPTVPLATIGVDKPASKSKTIWINAIVGAVATAAETLTGGGVIPAEFYAAGMAVLNIVLRFLR